MRFTFSEPLRFSDTDAMGHVNHARFLAYLEDARVALFSKTGSVLGAQGVILARIEVDYRQPIRLSAEPVHVDVWVTAVGTKSFTLDYSLTHGGVEVAAATSVIVAFDYVANRSRELTEMERTALDGWRDDEGARA